MNVADGDLMHLNVLVDLSNLIFIGAYLVKDILWLRLLAVVGSLVIIPYYLLQTEPLWNPAIRQDIQCAVAPAVQAPPGDW